ncbi:MAG: CpaF family protein [Candidatus Omnitrophica bacterium]|nr:CpaF family protein [Candidatus Omnitrophota bacterium]
MNLDRIRNLVQQHLITKTDFLSVKDKLDEDQLRIQTKNAIDFVCAQNEIVLMDEEKGILIREMVSSVISLGPLRPLMEDDTITEIMINGPSAIYLQRNGKIELSDVKFSDTKELMHTIQKILSASSSGRRVDESSPYVDFSFPDGSRVNIILPPVSLVGPVLTIRKFSSQIETLDDLLKLGTLSPEMGEFLVGAIKAKLNIIFSGATGTGKTTALNVLSKYIPEQERIITIEDTAELGLKQQHVVRLQAKSSNIEGKGAVSIRDLFVNSLRMRPDRIIIGEVRGSEALDLIQSISSGHSGSLAIVHGDSPRDCYNRLVTMLLMSGIHLSVDEIRRQIVSAIDLIVHTELFIDGKRRITHITDLQYGKESDEVLFENIFYYKQEKVTDDGKVLGNWFVKKRKPSFYSKFVKRNIKLTQNFFE